MSDLIVNNPNILIDAPRVGGTRTTQPPDVNRRDGELAALKKLREIRREIDRTVCSSTWAEDCLFRGADYPPDFKCGCPVCRARFPERLHPRPVRESAYAADCQVEAAEDPEFAEEFARLRNDRLRAGSVFIGRSSVHGAGARAAQKRAAAGGEEQ
jgi:hypothetical protein